jgi:predicted metal-binding membrane protein
VTSIELARAPGGRRLATITAIDLLGLSAAAWVGLAEWSRSMGNGPGPMGLRFGAFVGMWTVMMAAVMLPAATTRSPIRRSESTEAPAWKQHAAVLEFAVLFIGVWTVMAIPAYWAAVGMGHAAGTGFGPRVLGAALFLVYAGFQLSPVKARLLNRCRASSHAPPSGLRYGVTCVACSWATMGLMFAFGLMSIGTMAILAGVIYGERRWANPLIPRATALAGLLCGIAVLTWPALAPGLTVSAMTMHMSH